MSVSLSTLARERVTKYPEPNQKYGLSIALRKRYPGVVLDTTVAERDWSNVPPELVDLLRQRIADDTMLATHVLRSSPLRYLKIRGKCSTILEHFPGVTSTFIDVAPGAVLELQERTGGPAVDSSPYASALVLLRAGAGAQVRWRRQSVDAKGSTMVESVVVLARDAVLEHTSALLAADALRDTLQVVLQESGATVLARTLFAGALDHQFDLSVTAEHRAPRTKSDLRVRGVLDGKAQAVVRGLVRVAGEARGADGYQRIDTLLLSPTAEVDPVPTLEINTNDVRCTHGVTTGHVNPEHLFYLQSRGYSSGAAQALLVGGFLRDIIDRFPECEREHLQEPVRRVVSSTP